MSLAEMSLAVFALYYALSARYRNSSEPTKAGEPYCRAQYEATLIIVSGPDCRFYGKPYLPILSILPPGQSEFRDRLPFYFPGYSLVKSAPQ